MARPRPADAERQAPVPASRPAPTPRAELRNPLRPTPYRRTQAHHETSPVSPGPPVPPEPPGPPEDERTPLPTAHGNVVIDRPAEIVDAEPGRQLPLPPSTVSGPDVWDLVRRTQEGDAEAFGELYDHYVSMVHRYVYHRVGDRATAEDVTSETFVRALRRIDSLSFQGRDVGAWLITIARNIVFDHTKSSRYRLEVTTADMRDADTATEGPEDAVLQQLSNEQLVACMRQLGSEQQECLSLRFLQGMSVAETAQIMGKRDGAIKALQHRAVRRLAGLLPQEFR
jgi:RNA polymerase sigma-70 factor (TIGR02952 family)